MQVKRGEPGEPSEPILFRLFAIFESEQDRLAEVHLQKALELGQRPIKVSFEACLVAAHEILASGPFEGNVRRGELLPGFGPNPQGQARLSVLLNEPNADRDCRPQQTLDLGTRAVRCTEPDDFWWVAPQHTSESFETIA